MSITKNTKSVSLTRTLLPVMFAYALVGLSFGTLAISAGLPPAVPILLSLLVFAGSAQFAALGVVLGVAARWRRWRSGWSSTPA